MTRKYLHIIFLACLLPRALTAQDKPLFRALGIYTAREDPAHISFVHEANPWFAQMAAKYHFRYDSTSDWSKLNRDTLATYYLVIFLDTRPEKPEQRRAFQEYMEQGGAWMGFHFSAFALTPSAYNQDWNWYHNQFLGSGQYAGNTWRPTPAIVRVQKRQAVTRQLPETFKTAPNEWYRWERDLRQNQDIDILLAIDSSSFPLGTGPKPNEIWHSGYYPVVWTNRRYRMIYFNMGHNDMDYGGTNQGLSSSFSSPEQNRLIINALLWLGQARR